MKSAELFFAAGIAVLAAVIPIASRAEESRDYLINPGDLLTVTVWKEPDLTMDVLVRPDGRFSFPLAGDIQAAGHSIEDVRQALKKHIDTYIPDAVVTVMAKETNGNVAYVVGKVTRPGPVSMVQDVTVMQALSHAGGTAQFAKLQDILVLRHSGGSLSALHFDYAAILDGEGLDQNVLLQPGDVVVVP